MPKDQNHRWGYCFYPRETADLDALAMNNTDEFGPAIGFRKIIGHV